MIIIIIMIITLVAVGVVGCRFRCWHHTTTTTTTTHTICRTLSLTLYDERYMCLCVDYWVMRALCSFGNRESGGRTLLLGHQHSK